MRKQPRQRRRHSVDTGFIAFPLRATCTLRLRSPRPCVLNLTQFTQIAVHAISELNLDRRRPARKLTERLRAAADGHGVGIWFSPDPTVCNRRCLFASAGRDLLRKRDANHLAAPLTVDATSVTAAGARQHSHVWACALLSRQRRGWWCMVRQHLMTWRQPVTRCRIYRRQSRYCAHFVTRRRGYRPRIDRRLTAAADCRSPSHNGD